MNFLIENWGFVSKGLWMTLRLALVVLLFTTLISTVFGVLATVKNRVLFWTIHGYVELFRSIPLIVNVFFIFFGAPMLGLDLSPFAAVTTGLTLWGSANGIEIVRGGLESVARHQWKSAWALAAALADLPVRHRAAVDARNPAGLHGAADHAGAGHVPGRAGGCRRVPQGRPDHHRARHGHDRRQPGIQRLRPGAAGLFRHLFIAELAQPLSRTPPGSPGEARHYLRG